MKEVLVLYHDDAGFALERRMTSSPSSVDPADFGLQSFVKIILVMTGGGHNSYKLEGKEVKFHG